MLEDVVFLGVSRVAQRENMRMRQSPVSLVQAYRQAGDDHVGRLEAALPVRLAEDHLVYR